MSDKFLAVMYQGSTNNTVTDSAKVFSVTGDIFTQLPVDAIPGTSSFNSRYCADFTPDGNYLVTGGDNAAGIRLYARSGNAFVKTYESSAAECYYSIEWSSTGTYLAVNIGAAPYLLLFKRVGDVLSPLTAPALGLYCPGITWIGDDYLVCSVGNVAVPIMIFKRNVGLDTFALISAPPNNFTGGYGLDVCASSDGLFLAAVSDLQSGTNLNVFKRNGDSFTRVHSAAIPGRLGDIEFSTMGDYLFISSPAGNKVLKRNGDNFSEVYSDSLEFGSMPVRVAWSGDDIHIAVSYAGGSNLVYVYKRVADSFSIASSISPGTSTFVREATWWPNVKRNSRFRAVSGHIYDADGNPLSRVVRAYNRASGNLISETVSSEVDGTYFLDALINAENYIVLLDDTKNAMIYDHIVPTLP